MLQITVLVCLCFTAQRGKRERAGAAIKSPLAQPDLCGKSFIINIKITQRRGTTATHGISIYGPHTFLIGCEF